MIHGGRVVAQALKAEGVSHLFTLCGGHIQSIYDGCLDEGIRVVDTRHEQSAGHAADGYARVTGKPGVCAVTAGPGVTDVVTAAANAFRAGVPMVIIGGAGPRVFQHMGSLQDMDHIELMKTVTKWAVRVDETRRIFEFMTIAFRKAMSGVPGPVFLEMPLDLLMEFVDAETIPRPANYRSDARPAPDPRYLAQAIERVRQAKKPMAIVGSQVRWSRDPLGVVSRFVETGIPTFVNGMARGLVDPTGPHFLNRSRKVGLKNADLIVICGTPFDFRLAYGISQAIAPGSQSGNAGGGLLTLQRPAINPNAAIVQIDLDAEEVGRNRANGVEVGLVGDTGLLLEALVDGLGDLDPARLDEWRAQIQADEAKQWDSMRSEIGKASDPPNPLRVCDAVNRFVRPGDIVVGDGGDFIGTAAYVVKPYGLGSWMDPGPLGTLGVGPGYAMAAKLLRPEARVILLLGDGTFGLSGMEFEALARQNIPVVGIVGNDAGWTQILRGQKQIYGEKRVVATTLDFTRYDKIVEACGGHGEWVETDAELVPALERAFASQKPSLVNIKIASSLFRSGSISV
ncbi:MAG: acetolactate synthase [Myxococcales bacterium]|nr:acetolactate synthase [Myxococcales bacterium]